MTMPEGPEYRIMSDFINQNSKDKQFKEAHHISKGNTPELYIQSKFTLSSISNGKDLILHLKTPQETIPIHVFMGMSGNWKYVPTDMWNETKFIRFRMDDESGNSLILHGGYMGPKYSIGKPFSGTKRGPDPTKEYNKFKDNILTNLEKKSFDKPICEVLLNQEYFNGIGNYIRSTILYYADVNPFESGRTSIQNNPQILELCKEVPLKSYQFNGGQLKDWKNPNDVDSNDFQEWVYYQKGHSCRDKLNRTFWFNPKWDEYCPYKIKK
jgi:endonuclease VIII-like 1